jgi:hypothetical protein
MEETMCLKHGKDIGIRGVMNMDSDLVHIYERMKNDKLVVLYSPESLIRPGHSVLIIETEDALACIYIYDDGIVYLGEVDDGVS